MKSSISKASGADENLSLFFEGVVIELSTSTYIVAISGKKFTQFLRNGLRTNEI